MHSDTKLNTPVSGVVSPDLSPHLTSFSLSPGAMSRAKGDYARPRRIRARLTLYLLVYFKVECVSRV